MTFLKMLGCMGIMVLLLRRFRLEWHIELFISLIKVRTLSLVLQEVADSLELC